MTAAQIEPRYLLVGDVYRNTNLVAWISAKGALLRFDYRTDAWVRDNSLTGIFVGSPESRQVSEQKAREVIERNGGEWQVPKHPSKE